MDDGINNVPHLSGAERSRRTHGYDAAGANRPPSRATPDSMGLSAFNDGQNSFLASNAVFVLAGVRAIGESAVVIDRAGGATLIVTPAWDQERSPRRSRAHRAHDRHDIWRRRSRPTLRRGGPQRPPARDREPRHARAGAGAAHRSGARRGRRATTSSPANLRPACARRRSWPPRARRPGSRARL